MRAKRPRAVVQLLAGVVLATAALVVSGCGGSRPATGRDCPEFPGAPADPRSWTFVLTQSVRPENAPVPHNDSEAILFSLVYETLVDAACDGELIPGLAGTWRATASDSTWTLDLTAGSSFSNGAPVTAGDTKEAWRRARARAASSLAEWTWDGVGPVEVVAGDRLRVRASGAGPDLPRLLTHPTFAIGLADESPWPFGTHGRLRAPRGPEESRAEWVWERGDEGGEGAERILFRVQRGADPRDIPPSGADAFFVRDRRALGYLEQLEGFRVTPFPFSRLYVLVTPASDLARRIHPDDIQDLADRVAVAPARPTVGSDGFRVRASHRGEATSPRPPLERIVFPAWDADALAIAERLSFLWSRGTGGEPPAIVPRKPGEFLPAIRSGDDVLYILPVFPRFSSESLQRHQLLKIAPWLASWGAALPLIETRGHLVTREGLVGLEAGADGMPRLRRAGWGAPGAIP